MGDNETAGDGEQQPQRQAPPARKQIVYPAGPAEVAILEGTAAGLPPGVKMIAFRFDAPWEAVCVPLTLEQAEQLGAGLTAPSVIVPDDASSITGPGARVPSGKREP